MEHIRPDLHSAPNHETPEMNKTERIKTNTGTDKNMYLTCRNLLHHPAGYSTCLNRFFYMLSHI